MSKEEEEQEVNLKRQDTCQNKTGNDANENEHDLGCGAGSDKNASGVATANWIIFSLFNSRTCRGFNVTDRRVSAHL